MEKNKKILIVGVKGMLGQELAKIFKSDKSYELTVWDKEEIDITKEREVASKIKKIKPNIIINAAAYNAVDLCEKDKREFEKAKNLNGKAPGHLAKIAKKISATLVHYSTDYVFNGQPEIAEPAGCSGSCASCRLHQNFTPQIGFKESDRPKPISNYGKSKLLGEVNVKKNTKKFYIIRLSKLFGKPAKAEGGKKSFFDIMLSAGKKSKSVKVVDEEISCFTYAPDLARKTKEIIEAKKPFGIYHVVNSDSCTWYEAVLELYKLAKLKSKVIPVSGSEFFRPAKRPAFSVLLNTKLNPMRSYKLALREYLKKQK